MFIILTLLNMSQQWMSTGDKNNSLLEHILQEVQKNSTNQAELILTDILKEIKKMNTNLKKMNELLAYKEWDWAPRSPPNTLNLSPRSHRKKTTGKVSSGDLSTD